MKTSRMVLLWEWIKGLFLYLFIFLLTLLLGCAVCSFVLILGTINVILLWLVIISILHILGIL